MNPLPSHQLQILQHSLGCDQYGRGEMYRNQFATDPNCADGVDCEALVALGLMESAGPIDIWSGLTLYRVTPAGKSAMLEQSPSPPKRSRSQQNYIDFLNADCGLTFIEYLKSRKKAASHR